MKESPGPIERLHQCCCVIVSGNEAIFRCPSMVSMDEPFCPECETRHVVEDQGKVTLMDVMFRNGVSVEIMAIIDGRIVAA